MSDPKSPDDAELDGDVERGDVELQGDPEPPPPGHDEFTEMFTEPQPFDTPPDEPVEIVGDVPWELRDDDEFRS